MIFENIEINFNTIQMYLNIKIKDQKIYIG